ncbi:SigE family RNA polymerase sigma factor [Hamadaea sp. NPDC051192]|uniref:SigE family RNA polymerase sigma factor n=1 Tax=Hamadaea sp. NPDC051192 TaxID=3154940 RepID=UPI003418A97B
MTFDEYLTERLPALLRYATVVTCDPHLAQDVTQEVLARAQTRWARISAADQPEAYLKRMILNEFLSWRRRWRRHRTSPLQPDSAIAADPATEVVQRWELLALVAALPLRQRAVIALRFYEDRSDADIANLLGCSAGTVRSLSSRAVASLRIALATDSLVVNGVPHE